MLARYVGLMSGTSIDGVDAAVVEFSGEQATATIIAAATTAYPATLHARVARLIEHPITTLEAFGHLDTALGQFFADRALAIIKSARLEPRAIRAIGHHGQTVYHAPNDAEPFTMQIGDPNVIAQRTGITTVADFRRADVALGGQGAPLACAFHAAQFAVPDEVRAIVNIGGIANLTLLTPGEPPIGFDSGPGNTLLDSWTRRHRGTAFDRDGVFSRSGRVHDELLQQLLADPYFLLSPPKSTGREAFNVEWLDRQLARLACTLSPEDVAATLAELTARNVIDAIHATSPRCDRIILCGGGAHNTDLRARIATIGALPVEDTSSYGISPDWIEAAAFAWLARARLECMPGNEPQVTGAQRATLLGGVYSSRQPLP